MIATPKVQVPKPKRLSFFVRLKDRSAAMTSECRERTETDAEAFECLLISVCIPRISLRKKNTGSVERFSMLHWVNHNNAKYHARAHSLA